jgi:MerR family transcriptional regulator, light-induced transcriptional regulator
MVKTQMTAEETIGNKLTSKETARILGVSEASVKRWADSGLLPVSRTVGGHRRFRPEDVALFQRSGFRQSIVSNQNEEAARVSDLSNQPLIIDQRALINEMFDTLLEGVADDVSSLLINLYLHGQSVARIADDVFCPAMRRIGDRWHQGELTVAQEHFASQTALTALSRLRAVILSTTRPSLSAVCCSAENDFHEIPVQIASLTLKAQGWKVTNLGASTPFYALTEAVEKFRPRLVCVSSTVLYDLDREVRDFREFRVTADRLKAAIVLGGAGFSGPGGKRFDADLCAENFQQLEAFAARMAGET